MCFVFRDVLDHVDTLKVFVKATTDLTSSPWRRSYVANRFVRHELEVFERRNLCGRLALSPCLTFA